MDLAGLELRLAWLYQEQERHPSVEVAQRIRALEVDYVEQGGSVLTLERLRTRRLHDEVLRHLPASAEVLAKRLRTSPLMIEQILRELAARDLVARVGGVKLDGRTRWRPKRA